MVSASGGRVVAYKYQHADQRLRLDRALEAAWAGTYGAQSGLVSSAAAGRTALGLTVLLSVHAKCLHGQERLAHHRIEAALCGQDTDTDTR